MLHSIRIHRSALLLAALLAGCGGGSGDPSNGNAAAAQSGTGGSGSTNGGTTTTTLSPPTTTSLAGQTTSTTSSSTSTSAGATTTTATSTTTTTLNASLLPPLSATPIKLAKYPVEQTLGTQYADWGEQNWDKGPATPAGNAYCGDYNRGFREYPHVHLAIFRNGERLMLPKQIGYMQYCIFNTNTDILNGVVDAFPEIGSSSYLTLGDFFYVWGKPLSSTNIAGIAGLPVVIYIEDAGRLSRYSGDPAKIELIPYRSITIQIGSALNEIPTYDWSNYTAAGE